MVRLRPRTHTIEDESERRFRDAIPPQWVVRRLDPDLIDLTVEVFDDAGHSTPHSFHVQLKATDNEEPQTGAALDPLPARPRRVLLVVTDLGAGCPLSRTDR